VTPAPEAHLELLIAAIAAPAITVVDVGFIEGLKNGATMDALMTPTAMSWTPPASILKRSSRTVGVVLPMTNCRGSCRVPGCCQAEEWLVLLSSF
jgi:hypothetical protein